MFITTQFIFRCWNIQFLWVWSELWLYSDVKPYVQMNRWDTENWGNFPKFPKQWLAESSYDSSSNVCTLTYTASPYNVLLIRYLENIKRNIKKKHQVSPSLYVHLGDLVNLESNPLAFCCLNPWPFRGKYCDWSLALININVRHLKKI